jgi:hypothetical protein
LSSSIDLIQSISSAQVMSQYPSPLLGMRMNNPVLPAPPGGRLWNHATICVQDEFANVLLGLRLRLSFAPSADRFGTRPSFSDSSSGNSPLRGGRTCTGSTKWMCTCSLAIPPCCGSAPYRRTSGHMPFDVSPAAEIMAISRCPRLPSSSTTRREKGDRLSSFRHL